MNKAIRSLLCVSLLSVASFSFAERYAFIVGINDYPTPVDAQGNPLKDDKGEVIDEDLRGCVNDGNAIADLLTGKYNFSSSNIRKIYNVGANARGFVENMKWLVTTAKAGDDVVFFYSGHGAQVDNPKAVEDDPADKIDEALVLADGTLVIDDLFDEVRTIFVNKGVNITFMFDCCFSGGMSRTFMVDGRPAKEKIMKNTARYKNYKPMSRALMNAARPTVDGRDIRNRNNTKGTEAWFYASVEEKPSVDLGGTADLPAHGLFTLLITTLLDKQPKGPANIFMEAIGQFASEKGFEQGPNATFSSEERATAPVFPGA